MLVPAAATASGLTGGASAVASVLVAGPQACAARAHRVLC